MLLIVATLPEGVSQYRLGGHQEFRKFAAYRSLTLALTVPAARAGKPGATVEVFGRRGRQTSDFGSMLG